MNNYKNKILHTNILKNLNNLRKKNTNKCKNLNPLPQAKKIVNYVKKIHNCNNNKLILKKNNQKILIQKKTKFSNKSNNKKLNCFIT